MPLSALSRDFPLYSDSYKYSMLALNEAIFFQIIFKIKESCHAYLVLRISVCGKLALLIIVFI